MEERQYSMDNYTKKLDDWAKNEVEILIKTTDDTDKQRLYTKAFYTLHSFATYAEMCGDYKKLKEFRELVIRLLCHRPLSPILDVPKEWVLVKDDAGIDEYQCIRYPSLYKGINQKTGDIRYVDTARYICIDINNSARVWTGGIGAKILEEMNPITFPYIPDDTPIRIYMECLTYHQKKESDSVEDPYDTFAITHFGMPNKSELVEVNRFFKKDAAGFLFEIPKNEYFSRRFDIEKRKDKG